MRNSVYKRRAFAAKTLEPRKELIVNADKYLGLVDDIGMDSIERVEFKNPKIGKPDFGSFRVVFKTPQLMES
ncbi:MAG: hypothetical protein LBN41_04385 [Enterobacteriaceae bacterium]|nr:hypothetical protein [Enterobacteriaceae bacterium]